jgi:uncharacterized protein (DUF736 family)
MSYNGDYQHKDECGALFVNAKKKDEKHPDYRGSAKIGGELMDVSAWIRTPKSGGQDYLSIAFREWKGKQP